MEKKVTMKEFTGTQKLMIQMIVMVAIAVLIEIFFFNFRSIQSAFYQESDYKQYEATITGVHPAEGLNDTYYMDEDIAEITIHNIGHEVKNVQVDVENVNAIELPYARTGGCDIIVESEDEYLTGQNTTGNFFVTHSNPNSQYVWFMSKGKVDSITIRLSMDAGYMFCIHDLKLNANRPVIFSLPRFVIIFICVLFLYAMRKKSCLWREDCIDWKGWKKAVIAALILGFSLTGFYFAKENESIAIMDNYFPYQELARSLENGQTSLMELPDETLLSLDNPYDLVERVEVGLDYRTQDYKFDYVLYDGKYYVYFGIVPCLVFYYPLYHFTKLNMPNMIPVFFCCVMFCIGTFMLLRELIRRYYPKTPFAMLLLMQLAMMFGCQIPFFMTQGENYILPIIMSMMLTMWGLFFWISSLKTEPKKIVWSRLLMGSVCMALVAGCRPTTVIYSFLAIPIFLPYCKVSDTGYTKKNRFWSILILLIPYAVVAAGLMYYNAIRFGSPFEFGTKYTLTLLNLNAMEFALDRSLAGLYESFLRLPSPSYCFPYIREANIAPDNFRHGMMFREMLIGGLIPCNLFLLGIIGLYPLRKKNIKKELFLFCNMILVSVILLVIFSTSYTGCVIYRYLAELSSPLFLVAFIAIMAMQERFAGKEYYNLFCKIFVVSVVMTIMFGCCAPFIPEVKFPLEIGNTELYYKIFYGFNFW